jgi:serine/threonine protein phosphatase PrpC
MRFAAATTVGNVRHENQDAIVIGRTVCAGGDRVVIEGELTPSPAGPLVAVIDGMGGHRGGREASTAVARYLLNRATLHVGTGADADREADERAVGEMVGAVDQLLHDEMTQVPGLEAMGATVAGVACLPGAMVVFNVGDSRVYQFADGYLQRVSEDDRAPSGQLLQSLGGTLDRVAIVPHTRTLPAPPGTRWLLCSDGMWDFVPFMEIQEALREQSGPRAVAGLLAAALDAGSTDNVSIVLVDP